LGLAMILPKMGRVIILNAVGFFWPKPAEFNKHKPLMLFFSRAIIRLDINAPSELPTIFIKKIR